MSTEMRMRAMEAACSFYSSERGSSFDRHLKPCAEKIYDWVMETPSHLTQKPLEPLDVNDLPGHEQR